MLVLTRRFNESIIINDNEISICVLDIRDNQVKLGIAASPEISIHREEIYLKIQAKKLSEEGEDE